jgi:CubicO group peptidase (beta-lactamase class C family)
MFACFARKSSRINMKSPATKTLLQLLIATATLCITPLHAAEDPLPRARPESVGMSSERLQRITQTLRAEVDNGRIAGMVVGIARKGRLVYHESVGYLDKTAGTPMPKDAIFSIASMTKPMTTVAAMMLYEESKLMLLDPVGKYFPQLMNNRVAVMRKDSLGNDVIDTVPARRPMNIQDLMRHTAGISYGGRGSTALHKQYPLSSNSSGRAFTADAFIDKLGSLPLFFQPGTTWDYSLSVDVLGLTVEKISGQTLGQFLQTRLWKPLNMNDTHFVIPPDKARRYARALPNNPDTGQPQTMPDNTKPTLFECGGGCAVSTVADYLRFAQMMLNKGRLNDTRILARKTVEYMTSDHLDAGMQNNMTETDPSRAGYGFGLGFAVRNKAGVSGVNSSVGEFSWGGAFGTNFWVDPKEELAVVYMSHNPGSSNVRRTHRQTLAALAYAALID